MSVLGSDLVTLGCDIRSTEQDSDLVMPHWAFTVLHCDVTTIHFASTILICSFPVPSFAISMLNLVKQHSLIQRHLISCHHFSA